MDGPPLRPSQASFGGIGTATRFERRTLAVQSSSTSRSSALGGASGRGGGSSSWRSCQLWTLTTRHHTSRVQDLFAPRAMNLRHRAPAGCTASRLSSTPSPSPRLAARSNARSTSRKPSTVKWPRAAQDASALAFSIAPATECLEQESHEQEQQTECSTATSRYPEAWDLVQSSSLPVCQLPFNAPVQRAMLLLNPPSSYPECAAAPPDQCLVLQAHPGQPHPLSQSLLPPLPQPPSTSTPNPASAASPAAPTTPLVAWGALLLLSLSYMHQACNSFAVPVMLPEISADLHLDDLQGALLTTGFSYLYALVLLPVGMLCDLLPRPKLLAAGVASWSALTLLASSSQNFAELLAARVGYAAAQAVQNPISFALIPELFPANKSVAVAIYNCSVYLGRALSYGAALAGEEMSKLQAGGTAVATAAAVAAATPLTPAESAASLLFVPLDKLDLSLVSILYTRGDYAAVMPNFRYIHALEDLASADPTGDGARAVGVLAEAAGGTGWREVLRWVAAPGFLVALALVLALPEPRDAAAARGRKPPAAAATAAGGSGAKASGFVTLLRSPAFMLTSVAAAFNDMASYSLIAWQSTFYERVYHLEPAQYAPVLAVVLPIGGIIGGVGGGWAADRAAQTGVGSRAWVTAGAQTVAAPVLLLSMLAGDANESFLALMVGFSLSEAWRAPAANMARSVAPAQMGSSASALYLCIRNLIGGIGPIGVTLLTQRLGGDLQHGMLLIPTMYLASGLMFLVAEQQFGRGGESREASRPA